MIRGVSMRVTEVLEQIDEVCQQYDKPKPLVICVSKTYPCCAIEEAYSYGMNDFGENKVQELLEKIEQIDLPINWHLIGHLQTNKVKYIIDKVKLIHSIDSIKLLNEVNAQAKKHGIISNVLLQINVSKEESKYGFYEEELDNVLAHVTTLTNVQVKGLMTIAPFVENPHDNAKYFSRLYEIYVDIQKQNLDNISMEILSSGMSNDFKVAIEKGSNCVRIGTAIFGSRQ